MSERVPAAIEAAIRADLQPVRRLSSPARRAMWLAPLVTLTLLAASSVFAFRNDATVLGWTLTWAASALQAAFALSLLALALGDAVPGRAQPASGVLLAAASVLAFSLALTLRTWDLSPTTIVPGMSGWIGRVCFAGTIVTAMPLLVAVALLASRAYVIRPWSAGGLYGLGAGLGADAGWRLFCHYSDPLHVFPAHTGAVLVTMVLGMLVASASRRLRR